MAFLQVQCFSKALNVQTTVNVILPEPMQGIGIEAAGRDEPPKALYLLHGYSDDHSIWMRRTSVERYAAAHNLAVIMPAVNHSFYTNEVYGEQYWDYVAEELPQVMHRFFKLSDRPEDTFVAGLSMGGYGAMKLALSFPDRFGAAACFSGALDIADTYNSGRHQTSEQTRVFGDISKIPGSDMDLFHLLEKNGKAAHKPRLYVSCGTADFLYHHFKKFLPAAEKYGWDVTSYEEPDVGHEWAFWDREIEKFIPWMLG